LLMKKLTIVAAVALCLGGAFWSWQQQAVVSPVPHNEATTTPSDATAASQSITVLPRHASTPPTVREQVLPDRPLANWNLQVVLKSTLEPVRGASVYFLPPDFDHRGLSEEQLAQQQNDYEAWLHQNGRLLISDKEGHCEVPVPEWGVHV